LGLVNLLLQWIPSGLGFLVLLEFLVGLSLLLLQWIPSGLVDLEFLVDLVNQ
jgi:hypothetical protein